MTANYAYVDGSFNETTGVYGGGGVLIDQFGKMHKFSKSADNPTMARMRNVAGEILGVEAALSLAKKLGMTTLTIFHDYEGLSKWVTGEWMCRKHETMNYAKKVKKFVEGGLKVVFEHVKGHSGNKLNDLADELAKRAVGLR